MQCVSLPGAVYSEGNERSWSADFKRGWLIENLVGSVTRPGQLQLLLNANSKYLPDKGHKYQGDIDDQIKLQFLFRLAVRGVTWVSLSTEICC